MIFQVIYFLIKKYFQIIALAKEGKFIDIILILQDSLYKERPLYESHKADYLQETVSIFLIH